MIIFGALFVASFGMVQAAVIASLVVSANAAIIYSNDFTSGSSSATLNGTTTTVGDGTWIARPNGATKADGSMVNGDVACAFLAFEPEAGKVYTLTATVDQPVKRVSTEGGLALAFTTSATTTTDFWQNNPTSPANLNPAVLYQSANKSLADPHTVDTYVGRATLQEGEGSVTGSQTFSIVLNTTVGSNWTAEWFMDGSSVRTQDLGTNLDINYIGFGKDSDVDAQINNLSLTVISEPAPPQSWLITGATVHDYSSQLRATYSPDNIVDGSGLASTGTNVGTHSTTSTDMYLSQDDPTPWLEFDLGAAMPLTEIHIWNGNQDGSNKGDPKTERGAQFIDVYVSNTPGTAGDKTDDGTWGTKIATITLGEAPATNTYPGQRFEITDTAGRYVRLDITGNYGAGVTSLSEVHFYSAIPEPAKIGFTSPPQTVATTEVDLAGTADPALVRGLWYEVRAGSANGPVVDYGALRAQTNWTITVRHLELGENHVTLFGQTSARTTFSSSLVLTLQSTFAKGAVRPRPIPGEVWFGGLCQSNDDLATQPNDWVFVQNHIDGLMFHSYSNGRFTGSSKADLAALMEPKNMRYIEEMGSPTDGARVNSVKAQTDPAVGWGAAAFNREKHGIFLSTITHDHNPSLIVDKLRKYPEWDRDAHLEWHTGEWIGAAPIETYSHGGWREAFKKYKENFPFAKVNLTKSVVHIKWGSYPAARTHGLTFEPLLDTSDVPILVDGQPVNFNYNYDEFLPTFIRSADEVGNGSFSYWVDFPWMHLNGVADGYAQAQQDREKLRAMEDSLQSSGAGFTMICNNLMRPHVAGKEDAHDLQFRNASLKNLYLHQAEGGAANRYVFESWYVGPYSAVPETKDGSYTNLALSGIQYLKGLKYPGGELQELEISVVEELPGQQFRIDLKNLGDVACLPALLAMESGSEDVSFSYARLDGTDITAEITSLAGFTMVDPMPANDTRNILNYLLDPNETYSIRVTIAGDLTSFREVRFEAFWNPQDPSGIIRDAASLKFGFDAVVTGFSGQTVAIWSKGAKQFIRSPGVDNGVLRADRNSYENKDDVRFLFFPAAGGALAIMDGMLERYLTHTNGKLASAVSGDAATRRFTLWDVGTPYYAIQADNGNYVRVDGSGELVVDAVLITDDSLFAIRTIAQPTKR